MIVAGLVTLACLLPAASGPTEATGVGLSRVGTLAHPAIREASGLVKSRRFEGVYWTHNDSGNLPLLFAVRRDGSLIREYAVGAPNVDWEDIAADDRGHLYIGDIGNNDNRLPLRAVYQFDEPEPTREGGPKALKIKAASYYRFPAGGRFDAEGLVIDGDRALIIAKTFDDRPAAVYAVPIRPPAPLIRPAFPERVGTLPGFTAPVTGADLSPDGSRLAVCSTGGVGVYARAGDGWRRITLRSFVPPDQIEAVCWDGDDLLLAGEGRGVFRAAAGSLRGRPGRGGRASGPIAP